MVEITHIPQGVSGLKKSDGPAPDPSIIKPVPIEKEWIMHKWFIALVKPTRIVPRQQREDVKALEAMQALGIPTWYPTGKKRKRRAGKDGKRGLKTVLLFPGYLFIAHDGDSAKFARSLGNKHIEGMLGIIGSGVPVRVPGHAMQALFAGDEQRQMRKELEIDSLKPGESVSVVDGPFAQFDGEVAKLINATHVEILLEILGRSTTTRISIDNLMRL